MCSDTDIGYIKIQPLLLISLPLITQKDSQWKNILNINSTHLIDHGLRNWYMSIMASLFVHWMSVLIQILHSLNPILISCSCYNNCHQNDLRNSEKTGIPRRHNLIVNSMFLVQSFYLFFHSYSFVLRAGEVLEVFL